jgi:hypothetical protein
MPFGLKMHLLNFKKSWMRFFCLTLLLLLST